MHAAALLSAAPCSPWFGWHSTDPVWFLILPGRGGCYAGILGTGPVSRIGAQVDVGSELASASLSPLLMTLTPAGRHGPSVGSACGVCTAPPVFLPAGGLQGA